MHQKERVRVSLWSLNLLVVCRFIAVKSYNKCTHEGPWDVHLCTCIKLPIRYTFMYEIVHGMYIYVRVHTYTCVHTCTWQGVGVALWSLRVLLCGHCGFTHECVNRSWYMWIHECVNTLWYLSRDHHRVWIDHDEVGIDIRWEYLMIHTSSLWIHHGRVWTDHDSVRRVGLVTLAAFVVGAMPLDRLRSTGLMCIKLLTQPHLSTRLASRLICVLLFSSYTIYEWLWIDDDRLRCVLATCRLTLRWHIQDMGHRWHIQDTLTRWHARRWRAHKMVTHMLTNTKHIDAHKTCRHTESWLVLWHTVLWHTTGWRNHVWHLLRLWRVDTCNVDTHNIMDWLNWLQYDDIYHVDTHKISQDTRVIALGQDKVCGGVVCVVFF